MISSYLANKAQLDDHAIHLLFSANRWEKRLLPWELLFSDKNTTRDMCVRRMSWLKPCSVAPEIGLLALDLVVYLDISPEKAGERGGYGGERYEPATAA
ncbi:hypothetical protein MTR67_023958 [Solanum verrucosum]|uniref:Uncharacterized protein n=1 Tax=Solanum verrucosum TaxID=315347 RepID=A0AAF0QY70_SOLVR|nr:hypothetical protein MTR67_023958 [Solanum verrucosum]